MRFCPTFCPLPKENFTEGTHNKDALGPRFCGVVRSICAVSY